MSIKMSNMSVELHHFFYTSDLVETRTGFKDEDLIEKAMEIPFVRQQITHLAIEGFHFVGDTLGRSNDGSKAYTDIEKRWIFIGRDKSTEEALLSLTYEMTNAKHAKKLDKIYKEYSADILPKHSRAEKYARAIMRVESEAAYVRSHMAIILGKESLIKNKKYLEIVKSSGIHHKAAVKEIFAEMVKNGTVHNGKKSALEHYITQYWVATSGN
jgi:hypothetical protein